MFNSQIEVFFNSRIFYSSEIDWVPVGHKSKVLWGIKDRSLTSPDYPRATSGGT